MLDARPAHKKAPQKMPKCRRRAPGLASSLMTLYSWLAPCDRREPLPAGGAASKLASGDAPTITWRLATVSFVTQRSSLPAAKSRPQHVDTYNYRRMSA